MLSITFKCPNCDFEWNNSYPSDMFCSEIPQCLKCFNKPVLIQSFDMFPDDDFSESDSTKKKSSKPKAKKK